MKCPFCGKTQNHVLESRTSDDKTQIRRRRFCESCNKRFTTYEKTTQSVLWVIKKDQKRELYDREKIKRGILRSIEKRPVTVKQVEELLDKVERHMLSRQTEEVQSKEIGKEVLKLMKKIDTVAWLRFASVYLEFEDLKDFEKAISKALK